MDVNMYWIVFPIMSICLLVMMFIFISLIYQIFILKKAENIHQFYVKITILCMVFFILTTLTDLVHAVISYYTQIAMSAQWFDPVVCTADTCYYFGCITLYTLIIGRLYYTFKDTQYSLSKFALFIYVILLSTSSGIMIYYVYVVAKDHKLHNKSLGNTDICLMIIDVILNTSMPILFITKLRKFILQMAVNDYNECITNSIKYDKKHLNKLKKELEDDPSMIVSKSRQYKLIKVVVRHTILSTVAIICNELFFLSNMLFYLYPTIQNAEWWAKIVYTVRDVEGVIILSVLYLNFNFNQDCYHCCCRLCDICCSYIFIKSTNINAVRLVT
eukprot:140157_1